MYVLSFTVNIIEIVNGQECNKRAYFFIVVIVVVVKGKRKNVKTYFICVIVCAYVFA